MIEIRELRKRYRSFVAVDGVSLTVPRGSLYALLGSNGAGKTTTIKCLAGLLRPSGGQVLVGGIDLAREPAAAKRRMGYVPDRPFLYDKLSGAELIAFMAELFGLDPAGVAARARPLLEAFELTGWEDELIEAYSYGMRQKLVLSAVLAREPEALVIDEPIVGLDPRAAKTLRELLGERARAGTAILMSTHSLAIAEQVADRIGIIAGGRLVAEGSLAELRSLAALEGSGLEDVFLALTRAEPQPPAASAGS